MNNNIVIRREFLKLSATGLGVTALSMAFTWKAFAQSGDDDSPFNFISDPDNPNDLEKEHLINLRLPVIAEDGSNVPLTATMENHPMEPDHYIKSFNIYNFNDPVISKGLFSFSPANGMAHLATQVRMDGGDANVFVVAECTKHGKWVRHGTLKVSLGGC